MAEKNKKKPDLEALKWLLKPLDLEKKQGFRNNAVVGGIQKWLPRFREKLIFQADIAPEQAAQMVACLDDYVSVSSGQREKKIAELLAVIASLGEKENSSAKASKAKPTLTSESKPSSSAGKERKIDFQTPVQYLKGVGPQRAGLLKKLGILTAEDVLRYYPRDWQDRRHLAKIQAVKNGEMATVYGEVKAKQTFTVRRGMNITKVILDDGTGQIAATWFNQPYLRDRFEVGQRVLAYGKVEFYRTWQIMNPDYEILEDEQEDQIHTGRIVPIYPLTDRLSQRVLRNIQYMVQRNLPDQVEEIFPEEIVKTHGFIPPAQALKTIHFPNTFSDLQQARQRLIFEELFLQQIAVARMKQRYQEQSTQALQVAGPKLKQFENNLPFTLTSAQESAVTHILKDLSQTRPMHRLLQGDVGSGKTIVAALAMLAAVDSKKQAAIMAPTEVLATQHYLNLKTLFEPLGLRLELFTSGLKARERRELQEALASGEIHMAVGTHALTQESIVFHSLGLAVVDEQHRFGVEQRATLRAKGDQPHILVMTATPIPRTLALTVYGDLDVTTIAEMPPGRMPVATQWLPRKASRKAYESLDKAVAAGQQGFVIFPLIDESEKIELKALTTEYQRLSQNIFPNRTIGLLHGRLTTAEKESIMNDFKDGKIQILASTTVVEVGIDIPNASVMIIEDADRFGLAALHQLRGRIGRGRHVSHCYLIADPHTEESKARMRIMSQVKDGFRLAEEDLKMRGPGEFFGLRQHGLPDLKLADLIRDAQQIEVAREEAMRIIENDPRLEKKEHINLQILYQRIYADQEQRALAG
ncbi:ATP-dependent DNA helicase RecG [bacterium]|nr:ATP-dependent DNA helicase RecG [bacterium]